LVNPLGKSFKMSEARRGSAWRLCAGCASPVKTGWNECPKCNTQKNESGDALLWAKLGSTKLGSCSQASCGAPVRVDWGMCPGCGSNVLRPLDWDICQTCHSSVIRPGHLCPGCGALAPLRGNRLPLLAEQLALKRMGESNALLEGGFARSKLPKHSQVDPAAFLLTTTPRYWEKQIKMLELQRKHTRQKPQSNPYAVTQKIVTRSGGEVHGWLGLPTGYAPASIDTLSLYEVPYPRKGMSPVSRQHSLSSTWFSSTTRSPRGIFTARHASGGSTLERESSSRSIASARRELSRDSLSSEWCSNLSRQNSYSTLSRQNSSFSISPEREHLLEGHVLPGKLWRENSTFKELAKLRILIEVPEIAEALDAWARQGTAESSSDSEKTPNAQEWESLQRKSTQRQMDLQEEMTTILAKDLKQFEALEDLLEVRRDSSGGWYLPNGKCLHWSETQKRNVSEKAALEQAHAKRFGTDSVHHKWFTLQKKMLHHAIVASLRRTTADYNLENVLFLQKCARRFLKTKQARASRAKMWAKLMGAATRIQSLVRRRRDWIYSRFVKKCR